MDNTKIIEIYSNISNVTYEDLSGHFHIADSTLKNCIFKNVKFTNSTGSSYFDESKFKKCKFFNCDFTGVGIRWCSFDDTQFIDCKGIINYVRTINIKKTNAFTNTSLIIKQIDERITINGKRINNNKYNGYDVENLIIDDNWSNIYKV